MEKKEESWELSFSGHYKPYFLSKSHNIKKNLNLYIEF